jgi:glycolate oxidase iron-sulfur subunit
MTALRETRGARGRVLMLEGLAKNALEPASGLSDDIFSCILCEACRDLCPVGIDIPEAIYRGRNRLRRSYRRGRLIGEAARFSMPRLDTVFSLARVMQKLFFRALHHRGYFRYVPQITSVPFKNGIQLYKSKKRVGRVAIFAGCSVNYLYPNVGDALLNVLISKGFEVVILKGEVCCGAPMRSLGFEGEASELAHKNIDLFKKLRVEATISLCPTCTMVVRNQYPRIAGDSITSIRDVNEFFTERGIAEGLEIPDQTVTYHDPCHLSFGLGIRKEPREVISAISGLRLVEMTGADECCGFGGFFSTFFKDLSRDIGKRKLDNITATRAKTVVTSCPGCMMQIEDILRSSDISAIRIKHVVEMVEEAMHEQAVSKR